MNDLCYVTSNTHHSKTEVAKTISTTDISLYLVVVLTEVKCQQYCALVSTSLLSPNVTCSRR